MKSHLSKPCSKLEENEMLEANIVTSELDEGKRDAICSNQSLLELNNFTKSLSGSLSKI
jgi:hypothetical protein